MIIMKKDGQLQRVEKHLIFYNNPYFKLLDEFCFKSKNLYNFANYNIRQEFIHNNIYLPYNKMDKLLKQDDLSFDYKQMPGAKIAQQTLRLLDKNWKSFFVSIKDYSIHPDKYLGRPKLPKYKKKNGRHNLILTNQSCKLIKRDNDLNYIQFPKSFNGFMVKTKLNDFQQVRILPRNKYLILEIVYNLPLVQIQQDNNKYISIDIGVDNLATIVNNCGIKSIIISGRKLKSINQYYNKQISHYREVAKRMNNLDYTNRMNKLTIKRNNMITDLMHKASKSIINYALSCGANTIIIGKNKNWKQKSNMSKKVNQKFIQIPTAILIEMVKYKAENIGLNIILTEESYTSGTSFLDNEEPVKENYNKSRRIYRGLFVSNIGKRINADINGALQIMRKVFPNMRYHNGIEDIGLYPIRVGI